MTPRKEYNWTTTKKKIGLESRTRLGSKKLAWQRYHCSTISHVISCPKVIGFSGSGFFPFSSQLTSTVKVFHFGFLFMERGVLFGAISSFFWGANSVSWLVLFFFFISLFLYFDLDDCLTFFCDFEWFFLTELELNLDEFLYSNLLFPWLSEDFSFYFEALNYCLSPETSLLKFILMTFLSCSLIL